MYIFIYIYICVCVHMIIYMQIPLFRHVPIICQVCPNDCSLFSGRSDSLPGARSQRRATGLSPWRGWSRTTDWHSKPKSKSAMMWLKECHKPSSSHHHFYRWYVYQSQTGGWYCFNHIRSNTSLFYKDFCCSSLLSLLSIWHIIPFTNVKCHPEIQVL